jgi:hypothetical protein
LVIDLSSGDGANAAKRLAEDEQPQDGLDTAHKHFDRIFAKFARFHLNNGPNMPEK